MEDTKALANIGLQRLFRSQHATITRAQALGAGATAHFVKARIGDGSWIACHRGVYRLAGAARSANQAMMAAVLAAGPPAAASHESAAWLWGLLEREPDVPTITVPKVSHPRLRRVQVYRSGDFQPERIRVRDGVPCTDPLRTLIDVGGLADPSPLQHLIDRGLSRRLVTVEGLLEESARLRRRGRRGPATIAAVLGQRGFVGVPDPSVLESRLLRLLDHHGLRPDGVEIVTGSEGQYRIDVQVRPRIVAEVDGYSYHWSPEHKQRDEQRRNRIVLDGNTLLVFTWLDVVRRPDEVAAEIRAAIAA
jgi:hypothetical protein